MTDPLPLARHCGRDSIVAIRDDGAVTLDRFLGDVTALAASLPSHRYLINLCRDRYRFTVTLGAALLRGQVSLLPPSDVSGVLGSLAAEFGDLYCLHDGDAPALALPCFAYPARDTVSSAREMPCFPEDQPAVVLFTSGSTGRPMPHAKSWGHLVRSAQVAGQALGVADLPGATIVGTVPQQHSYGFESTVMLALQHGLALHHGRPFYPADVVATLDATPAPRVLVTTPVHLRALLADPETLPAVELIVSATAPLALDLAIEAERRLHAPLLEIYGCSEAGQLATRRTSAGDEWRWLDGVALRQEAEQSWVSGAPVAGTVELGDLIETTMPGRFRLHGRIGDLVNIAGKRTSLAHLNHHLNAIAGVIDGVFIAPDATIDETARLMAFVVAPGLSADTILAALRQHIDPVFLPRPLRLVDTLPRNVLGKLPHAALTRLKNDNDNDR